MTKNKAGTQIKEKKENEIIPGKLTVNMLAPVIDHGSLDRTYAIYEISVHDMVRLPYGAGVLDLQRYDTDVQAVSWQRDTDSRRIYILLPAGKDYLPSLREHVRLLDPEGHLIVSGPVSSRIIPDYILLRLLGNAVQNSVYEGLSFSNVTSRLLTVDKVEGKGDVIVALEICIRKDCRISLDVRTFSSRNLDRQGKLRYGKGSSWNTYPHYVYDRTTGRMLRAVGDSGGQLQYIMKSVEGKKQSVDFMNNGSLEAFAKSKMGVLGAFMRSFNEKYEGIAHIRFRDPVGFTKIVLEKQKDSKPRNAARVREQLKTVNLVNRVDDDESADTAKAIMSDLRERLKQDGIAITQYKRRREDCANLVLVHDAEYYSAKGLKDPYTKDLEYIAQHLTVESSGKTFVTGTESTKAAVYRALLNNLLVKQDLTGGKVTSVSLQGFVRSGPFLFAIRTELESDKPREAEDKVYLYSVMVLQPDDTFEIRQYSEADIPKMDNREKELLWNLDTVDSRSGSCPECAISDEEGHCVVITDTGLYPVPDIEGTYVRLKVIQEEHPRRPNGTRVGLRGKNPVFEGTELALDNPRMELFGDLRDINYLGKDGSFYYWTGEPADGAKAGMTDAEHIRRISGDHAEEIGRRLIPTFDNVSIRNGVPSVRPFAVKYLNEAARSYIRRLQSAGAKGR